MKIKNTLLLFLILIITTDAHAYIDPGSGGALISAILAFFAAIVYTLKKYFYNLKDKFKSISRSKER